MNRYCLSTRKQYLSHSGLQAGAGTRRSPQARAIPLSRAALLQADIPRLNATDIVAGLVKLLVALALLLPAGGALAATVIEVDASGVRSKLMMDERYARMDSADGSYLLHDRQTGQSYLVLPQSRQWMELPPARNAIGSKLRMQLIPKAGAPELLGYRSQRYRMVVNGSACGEVYASKQASEQLGVAPMLQAMARLADQQLAAMGIYVAVIDTCTRAAMRILHHSDRIGLPLRIVDNRGAVVSDIVSIRSGVSARQQLALPANYQRVATVRALHPG